jgi:DNA (cytosine-5)-methyltransferase 1
MRFIDLFAGLGGFHYALRELGHECVFACESEPELRELYQWNFQMPKVNGDIRAAGIKVPKHDILCAGFPCQPFSKSGSQLGSADETRGTLFHEIVAIARKHEPSYLILENVGNFERHDRGNTWRVARRQLESIGYCVRGTAHKRTGGHGLISPHHFGFPHHRERFFIVASKGDLPVDPFPKRRSTTGSLWDVIQFDEELTTKDAEETKLSAQQTSCIRLWNRFLKTVPVELGLPAGPLWSDEFGARYPFEDTTPWACDVEILASSLGVRRQAEREELLSLLPNYASRKEKHFPSWKIGFIANNRRWHRKAARYFPHGWLEQVRQLPPSLRKLEWNCGNDAVRNLWNCVLQFRPSGLRAKRFENIPALVAMTTTQIPILGPKRRFITRTEGLRLQGLPDSHRLPIQRAKAFAALGNAVHVGVVNAIAQRLLDSSTIVDSEGEQFGLAI